MLSECGSWCAVGGVRMLVCECWCSNDGGGGREIFHLGSECDGVMVAGVRLASDECVHAASPDRHTSPHVRE